MTHAWIADRECLRCRLHFSSRVWGAGRCPDCRAPSRALATLARVPAHVEAKRAPRLPKALHDYRQPTPGQPLGRGMPTGSPLRADGESHAGAWKRILRHDLCCYCTRRLAGRGTIDHIIPTAAGGTNTIDNMAGACASCNRTKTDLPLLMFLLARC